MKYYIGQTDNFSKTITESDIYLFAGISGDFNPVHVNRIEAEKSLFGKQVAHGILGASLISTVLGMKLPGPGTVYLGQNLKFIKPIYIGDTITARVEIEELENGKATLSTVVTNQDGKELIQGKAWVRLP